MQGASILIVALGLAAGAPALASPSSEATPRVTGGLTELVADGSCQMVGSKGLTRFLACPTAVDQEAIEKAARKACGITTACNAWIWDEHDEVAVTLPIAPVQKENAKAVWSGKSQSLIPCDGAMCGRSE